MEDMVLEMMEYVDEFIEKGTNKLDNNEVIIYTMPLIAYFEYDHDTNMAIKKANGIIKKKIPKNKYATDIVDIGIPDNEGYHAIIFNMYRREDKEQIDPTTELVYIASVPSIITGNLDQADINNLFIRELHNSIFNLVHGLNKKGYASIKIGWKKNEGTDDIDDSMDGIVSLAKNYGLKTYVDDRNIYIPKLYIYQTMSPELETIIKRRESIKLVK